MKKLISNAVGALLVASALFSQAVHAASDCEAKAIGKNGKPLAGAAKTAFVKKCETQAPGAAPAASACAEKAVSKSGKSLAGAAKNAFIKKCEAGG